MAMTRDDRLQALLRLPWTLDVERSDEGYLVARCRELPASIAIGNSEEELEQEFWASHRATLACLLDDGDAIPLPRGVKQLPWEVVLPARARATVVDGMTGLPVTPTEASVPTTSPDLVAA